MSLDGDQCVIDFSGAYLGKAALGLSGSMPSHGRGRRFKSSPAYQEENKKKGHPVDGFFFEMGS